MRRSFTFLTLVALFASFSLAGCGGDGDGGGSQETSLSGIAATGAPIAGEVCGVDRDGDDLGCVDIAADGSFTLPTTGARGPIMVGAFPTGGGQSQYSYSADRDGVVNINPFTTLSLLLASDYADLDAYYSAWSQAYRDLDENVLSDAVEAVLDHFSTELAGAVANGFDPFRTSFATDGSGFDGVLDALNFAFDFVGGTVSLNGNGLVIDFDPVTNPGGGDYRLTITVSVSGAPTQQAAVINNIAKPANQGQFCSPEIYNDYFSSVGSFTVTDCSFDGTVGRISANVSVSGFSVSYVATYTYSAL